MHTDRQNNTGTVSKIKVIQVIPSMNVGGREKVVLDILENLNRDRFDLELVCLGDEGTMYDRFKATEVPIWFFRKKPGFKPGMFLDLYKFFKKHHYHIVHSHNPGAFIYSAVASCLAGTSVLINSEHGYGSEISWRKKNVESVLANRCYLTLAVSNDLRNLLAARPFCDAGKVQTLYNGIDVVKYTSSTMRYVVRSSLGISNRQILIGTVGRLAAVKDYKTLIRGFEIFHRSFPESRLVIVGEGGEKEALTQLSNELALNDKILFTGERNDIPDLLSGMDIFVLSSVSEGISITLLESMAAQLPVVATAVGGNVEVVEDGLTGLLVPAQNPDKIAEALVSLCESESMSHSFGESGKKRVEKYFSIQHMIEKLEIIYSASV